MGGGGGVANAGNTSSQSHNVGLEIWAVDIEYRHPGPIILGTDNRLFALGKMGGVGNWV